MQSKYREGDSFHNRMGTALGDPFTMLEMTKGPLLMRDEHLADTHARVHLRPMLNPVLYVLCGLIVGALVGLTGVGGGSMMTPILVLVFGQSPAVAVGTDLMFSASTKLVATASFGISRRVDWRIVARLMLGSVPATGAVILWFWLNHRPPTVVDEVISRCLAVILALAAMALLLQGHLRRLGLKLAPVFINGAEHHKVALTVIAGSLAGILLSR